MQAVRDPLLVITVAATALLAMMGNGLRTPRPFPWPATSVVAPAVEVAVPDPAPHTSSLSVTIAPSSTSGNGQGAALPVRDQAAPRNPLPAFQAPVPGNDLRMFLLNMARAEWEHSSLGIHVEPAGMAWIDDPVKSGR